MLFSLTNLPSPFCFFCSHRHPKTSVDHRRGEWPSDLCRPLQKVFRHSRSAKGGSDLIHEPPLRPFSQHQTSCLRGTFVRISFARGRLFVLASVKAGRCSSQSPAWGCNPNLGVIDGCHCLRDFPVSVRGTCSPGTCEGVWMGQRATKVVSHTQGNSAEGFDIQQPEMA